eukprot:3313348-Pyramimonas_sp.AAC.1
MALASSVRDPRSRACGAQTLHWASGVHQPMSAHPSHGSAPREPGDVSASSACSWGFLLGFLQGAGWRGS